MQPPKALRKDPIVEAGFEIRFDASGANGGELLPGMLYNPLRQYFTQIVPTVAAQIPRQIRQLQPDFAYQAVTAIIGDKIRLGLGDQVVVLSFARPYPGWTAVRRVLLDVLGALQGTGLVAKVERISARYINIISFAKDFSPLRVEFKLGEFTDLLPTKSLRAEVNHRGYTHVVNVAAQADITQVVPNNPIYNVSGVLVDVDSIRNGPIDNPWDALPGIFDDLHSAEKEVFFGLLRDETIAMMDPVYE